MARENSLFFVDDYDGTRVESPVLPPNWIEVESDGQTYVKHPNMTDYRVDGAVGIYNPFNLNIGGDSTGTENGKQFASPANWRSYAIDRLTIMYDKIIALIALWDTRKLPVANFSVVPPVGAARGATVALDANASTGLDGATAAGLVGYKWECQDAEFVTGDATSIAPTIRWGMYATAGAKTVRLTVTDTFNRKNSREISYTVS